MASDRIPNRSVSFGIVVTLLATSLVLAVQPATAYAAGPMPYTNEAVAKLNAILETTKTPADANADNDTKVRRYIARHREAFAAAGYDYERSIIKIINDIQFERYVMNKATITLNNLARELLRLHVRTGVHPSKYLNRDCAAMLIEFRNLIRSNSRKYGSC